MSPAGVTEVIDGEPHERISNTSAGATVHHVGRLITPANKPRGRRISHNGDDNPDIYLTAATGSDFSTVSSRLRSSSRGNASIDIPSQRSPLDLPSPSTESICSPESEPIFSPAPTAYTPSTAYGNFRHEWLPQEECPASPSKGSGAISEVIKRLDTSSDRYSGSEVLDETEYESLHDAHTQGRREISKLNFGSSTKQDNDTGHVFPTVGEKAENHPSEPEYPLPQSNGLAVWPRLNFITDKPKGPRKHVEELLEFMREETPERELDSGFVYCFTEKSTPGYVKIGWAKAKEPCGPHIIEEELDMDSQDHQDVKGRIMKLAKDCSLETRIEFALYMPCAAGKMERLVHRTLHEYQRIVQRCRKMTCRTKHKEWYEVSVNYARDIVKQWQQFSNVKPYDKVGVANQFWHEAHAQHKSAAATGNHITCTVRWVNDHLPELTKKRGDELLGLAKKREDELASHDIDRKFHEVLEGKLEKLRDEEDGLQQKIIEFNSELGQAHQELANVQRERRVLEKTGNELLAKLKALNVGS